MLAEECKKEGIKLFFYHSHLDWFQENYFPRGNTGQIAGRPASGDWYKYLDFMDGQLTELLTSYGEIGGIWFDGHWDKKDAGYNSNFLLNVGPMPDGKIQPEFVNTLKEIGKWMEKNGETIYGTRGGPVSPRTWGVTTHKANKVFVHILNAEDLNLLIPDFGKKVKNITQFNTGVKLKFKQDAFGIAVSLPKEIIDETDTILVIEI
ncbi:MAG TPA: alpha-L-fucosidase [Bacteroidales bacterium]|nr:alpha-L-fucosidase [Bacteroidales bacterium]